MDSLQHLLSVAKHDTTRVYLLVRLGLYEQSFQKALDYVEEAMALAQKINYRKGIGMAYNQLGNQYYVSNYAKALGYYFKALQIREEVGDIRGLVGTNGNIGNVYKELGDYDKAFQYINTAVELSSSIDDVYSKALSRNNLGNIYADMQKPDSALYNFSRAYELFNASPTKYQMASTLNGLASLQRKMNNRELAFSYYRMAVTNGMAFSDSGNLSISFLGMAQMFREEGNTDSSIIYARQSLAFAESNRKQTGIINASELLAQLYHNKDEKEAFRYLAIAMRAKDSAFSREKQMQIENMNYAEQERRKESEERKLEDARERKVNLQYAAVALGMMILVILFFLFSHSVIANPKLIKFLGILSLLIVFEFINLFIHPYLDKWTNHSIPLMLLIMVCIAAMLIPLHHKLEHWITHKLVEKNNKIRLAAAKKTIAKLEGEQNSKQL